MDPKKLSKNVFIAVAVFGVGLYRLGAPFLEETDFMRKEGEKLASEIQQVRLDAAQYDKTWEKKIEDADRKVKARLPDKINSSEVLDYFVTQFDKQHPGTIAFQSATQSPITPVSFGQPGGANTQPRAARYRFEAQMHQTMLIPYVEHIEKYNGLYRVNDFTFEVPQGNSQGDTLKASLFFEFYLAPLDWVPPDKLAEIKKEEKEKGAADPAAASDTEGSLFRQVFVSAPTAPQQAQAPRLPAAASPLLGQTVKIPKLPKIEKIVGTSIVSDENIFEEGDQLGSWKIMRVDPRTKSVTLKSGSTVKTMVVK